MKKRMITGLKPTGPLTLGSWLGAIKPLIKYKADYEILTFVADLHALTIRPDAEDLRENVVDLEATLIAAGLAEGDSKVFLQSAIPAHSQLEWLLTCETDLPDLMKMPQYKNYKQKYSDRAVPAGMLMYPSLMNADILLYDADFVPVGADQKPHVDLTRDVAIAFNKSRGETFKIPEAIVPEAGAKIMSLSDPTRKMSKSESDKGTVYLHDDFNTVMSKFMKAKTDSEGKVYYDLAAKPGISNLLSIYAAAKSISVREAEATFRDETDYGTFKRAVAAAVIEDLTWLIQKRPFELRKIDRFIDAGNAAAADIASRTLDRAYKAVGLRW